MNEFDEWAKRMKIYSRACSEIRYEGSPIEHVKKVMPLYIKYLHMEGLDK